MLLAKAEHSDACRATQDAYTRADWNGDESDPIIVAANVRQEIARRKILAAEALLTKDSPRLRSVRRGS